MTAKQVCDIMLKRLGDLGAFRWHTAKSGSEYIKFRDTRIGSVRISDHEGRPGYHYKYSIFVNGSDTLTEQQMRWAEDAIRSRVGTLEGFHPNNYVIFDRRFHTYVIAENFEEYRNHVLGSRDGKAKDVK